MDKSKELIDSSKELSSSLDGLSLDFKGTVYNPLSYAWDNYSEFIKKSVREGQKALILGMNPGPFGMMQTGVPFGAVDAVKEYLGINGRVEVPTNNNPKRPILGMDEKRIEVSGKRLWGMAKLFGSADEFFENVSVLNYCPLGFIDESGRNITPDTLSKEDQKKINRLCDAFLKRALDILNVPIRIGIGRYAYSKLLEFGDAVMFTHPSPRNPKASAFWPEEAYRELKRMIEA